MDKKSALISWIKNGIMSIISKLQNRNTEPGVTDEKEQTVDSEPISRSENKTETHSPDKKELIDLKKELGESIDAILTKLFDGISGLLEEKYKDRLIGLEGSIEELKKKEKEKVVSDFKAYKELEKVRNLAETAKLSSEENIEKIKKITIEEPGIEKLEEKKEKIGRIKETGSIDLPADELSAMTAFSNYLKHAPMKEIEKMREMGLTGVPSEELKRINLIMGITSLLPEEDKGVLNSDRSIVVANFLTELQKCVNEMEIQLLYNGGVMLLKTGAFRSAYDCFDKITDITKKKDIKGVKGVTGAWLNRGFALGKLGDINGEIRSYTKALALSKEKKYEKASRNIKIAERWKKWQYLKQVIRWRHL